MEQFVIDKCYKYDSEGERVECLSRDIDAFYHDVYMGGGRWKEHGTIENLLCTLKNDITPYPNYVLSAKVGELAQYLCEDLPEILRLSGKERLSVCVVPRSKRESHYKFDQLLFRNTISRVVDRLDGFRNMTKATIRHTDTKTTHLTHSPMGDGGTGEMPYAGITKDTCHIGDVHGEDILLIDDIYTKSVGIDEDCIQALLDEGARSVIFYSIGKTVPRPYIDKNRQ